MSSSFLIANKVTANGENWIGSKTSIAINYVDMDPFSLKYQSKKIELAFESGEDSLFKNDRAICIKNDGKNKAQGSTAF